MLNKYEDSVQTAAPQKDVFQQARPARRSVLLQERLCRAECEERSCRMRPPSSTPVSKVWVPGVLGEKCLAHGHLEKSASVLYQNKGIFALKIHTRTPTAWWRGVCP